MNTVWGTLMRTEQRYLTTRFGLTRGGVEVENSLGERSGRVCRGLRVSK